MHRLQSTKRRVEFSSLVTVTDVHKHFSLKLCGCDSVTSQKISQSKEKIIDLSFLFIIKNKELFLSYNFDLLLFLPYRN